MMTNVTLQFPDLASLAKFRLILHVTSLEINLQQLTLACDCSSELVDEAVKNYGATIVTHQYAGRQMQS